MDSASGQIGHQAMIVSRDVKSENGKRLTVFLPSAIDSAPGEQPANFNINPDGTITVEFTFDEVKDQWEAAAKKIKTIINELTVDNLSQNSENAVHCPELSVTQDTKEKATMTHSDFSRLTVKQLHELAKSKGIAIARTRIDFLKLILVKNPASDQNLLRGKDLFDTVKHMHISRLRSKEDLIGKLSELTQ